MKLHRDIGVTQLTAAFILHRIREGWKRPDDSDRFSGPFEVDETYMGGKRNKTSNAKRKDGNRAGQFPQTKFDFLGYTIRSGWREEGMGSSL